MAREYKLIHCTDDAHPNRCQGIDKTGQCRYMADFLPDGSYNRFCGRHKGQTENAVVKEAIRNYRLTKFRAQVEQKADSSSIKSLREEIGITRQVLETFINRCEDDTDLMIHSNKISDLVIKIEKLVSSCHRLERSTGQLLDKSAIIQVAGMFVEIVSEYVPDRVQAEISEKLMETIGNIEVLEE